MTHARGFRFDLQRAIQAAGVVLRDRGPMDRMRLLKILYLASRKALAETGKPIFGGTAAALPNGPLHSELYNQIKGDANDAEWRKFFRNIGHTVVLEHDPGRLDLSPLQIETLNGVADWAEQFETFELSHWTHDNLPEYQKNKPPFGTSNPIPVKDILDALGFTPEEVAEVIRENQAHESIMALMDQTT
jgi:uncharacterized phage-associated protein